MSHGSKDVNGNRFDISVGDRYCKKCKYFIGIVSLMVPKTYPPRLVFKAVLGNGEVGTNISKQ
jgi:hypothetical protein